MSELVGFIQCTHRDCAEVAEFKRDKRGKFFTSCPKHGRLVASTNEAQAELSKMLDSGEVLEKPEDIDNGGVVKMPPGEDPPPEAEDSTPDSEGGGKGRRAGVAVLLAGLVGGLALWLRWKTKNGMA